MKWFIYMLMALAVAGCDNKKDDLDQERKKRHEELYKTPPPSDGSRDQKF